MCVPVASKVVEEGFRVKTVLPQSVNGRCYITSLNLSRTLLPLMACSECFGLMTYPKNCEMRSLVLLSNINTSRDYKSWEVDSGSPKNKRGDTTPILGQKTSVEIDLEGPTYSSVLHPEQDKMSPTLVRARERRLLMLSNHKPTKIRV